MGFHRSCLHQVQGQGVPPRVTIIQRKGTREISNLDEVVGLVNATIGAAPRVVDMATLSIGDQLQLAMHTDILILVHGAGLIHALWQPFGGMVLDIYPYHMPSSYAGSLVTWMRRSLPALELLHHPYDITNGRDQQQIDGTPSNDCQCPDYQDNESGFYFCGYSFFWNTRSLQLDPRTFGRHLQEGVQAWAQHQYQPPMSRAEFRKGWGSKQGRRPEYYGDAKPGISKPLCEWEYGPPH